MSRLACPCGHTIETNSLLTETEGVIHNKNDLFRSWEEGNDGWNNGMDMWECQICGRLGVDISDFCGVITKWYVPEDGEPGNLL